MKKNYLAVKETLQLRNFPRRKESFEESKMKNHPHLNLGFQTLYIKKAISECSLI